MNHSYTKLFRLAVWAGFYFLCSFGAQAQKKEPKKQVKAPAITFGRVSAVDFSPSPAGVDSTADAEVLYDFGEVRFSVNNGDIWTEFVRHRRIRIIRKSALSQGTVQVPTYKNQQIEREFLTNIEGYTYNLDGSTVKTDQLSKTGIASEKYSDRVTLEKFTLPNVREGSIIEYKYRLMTPFNVSHNPHTWSFQEEIPVRWSEYKITIPTYFYYKILMGGYLQLAAQDHSPANVSLFQGYPDAPATTYRFVVTDAPAFKTEKYITTKNDYLSKIDFELASVNIPRGTIRNFSVEWADMDRTLLELDSFYGQIKRAPFLRDVATLIRSQHPTDSLARLEAAYNYVRRSIKWDGTTGFTSNSTKKVFEAKKGDAGDVNLLLIGLLRELDFDVNPVILSTRSHGRIHEAYALLRQFDYVVAHVTTNGTEIMLDATDQVIKPGMLPTRCLNTTGRLIAPENRSRFVSLLPTERDVEMVSGTLTLADDGEVKGTLKQSRSGYNGWHARTAYGQNGEAKYLEDIRKQRPNWQITKTELSGQTDVKSTFDAMHTLTVPDVYSEAGERLYLWPMLTEGRLENPFKETTRLYPVDFGIPTDHSFSVTYILPAGVTVEELPKPAIISLPDKGGRFTYQITQNENQLLVTSRLTLRKPVYYAEEYGGLRELYALVAAKHAERVVLKRSPVANK